MLRPCGRTRSWLRRPSCCWRGASSRSRGWAGSTSRVTRRTRGGRHAARRASAGGESRSPIMVRDLEAAGPTARSMTPRRRCCPARPAPSCCCARRRRHRCPQRRPLTTSAIPGRSRPVSPTASPRSASCSRTRRSTTSCSAAIGGPLVMTSGNLSRRADRHRQRRGARPTVRDRRRVPPARPGDPLALRRLGAPHRRRPNRVRAAQHGATRPFPITLPFTTDTDILAAGPEQKNTFTLLTGGYAFVEPAHRRHGERRDARRLTRPPSHSTSGSSASRPRSSPTTCTRSTCPPSGRSASRSPRSASSTTTRTS